MHRASLALILAVMACSGDADKDSPAGEDTGVEPSDTDATDDTDLPVDSAPTADTGTPPLTPVPPVAGDGSLLISQLSYSGAVPSGGTDHYYSDQFVELVNTTSGPLDLSGVMLGEAYGSAGAINPGTQPDSFRDSNPDEVVLSSVWRVPDGTIVEAGEHLVIAHDGINHRPFSTVDLSGAHLETYVAGSGRDDDSPTVANLEEVHFEGGFDWLITVFGPSVVVLEAGTELGTESGAYSQLRSAPAAAVLDAVETLMDEDSEAFKRLPDSVDAGYIWVSDTYSGESVHRRFEAETWVDSNDAGADFVVGDPEPHLGGGQGAVTGDPTLVLGTGVVAYEPLVDSDDIELVAGPQGGWHVDVTLRASGLDPQGVTLAYEALNLSAQSLSYTTEATLFDSSVLPTDEGWDRVGDRIVFDIASAAEVVGSEVVLRVTAALDGTTWSDERTVTVVDNE